MRRCFTAVAVVFLIVIVGPELYSQQTRVADREAEWNRYSLPKSPFERQTDLSKVVLFRVPVEWKRQQTDKLEFAGPHGATLSVIVETIPDGIPLRDYVSALTQQLRSVPDSADSLLIRRTAMSGREAREIMFESSDGSEQVTKRIIWASVSGPIALSLVLIAPVSHAAEIEPYFKAVVQSVSFIEKYDFAGFEAERSWVIKDGKPVRVDEVQALAAALTALDGSARQADISRLAAIFASSPDVAIDMILDARPMVRAATYEAMGISRNNSLETFLVRGLRDPEPFVAEKAARSIAEYPNVVDLLRGLSFEWMTIESVARVWPFLNRSNQIKILNEAFVQLRVAASPVPGNKKNAERSGNRPVVTVQATVIPPGSSPPTVIANPQPLASDPSRLLNGLALLVDLPSSDFKLPLPTILAAKNDALTLLALDIGWWRNDILPAPELLKLFSSSIAEVRRLAALNLGQSGSVADIKIIEGFLSKSGSVTGSSVTLPPGSDESLDHGTSFDDTLHLIINRIRMREQIASTSGEAREQLIKKGLADPKLSTWIWYRYVREGTDDKRAPAESKPQLKSEVKVLPLGENLFPKDVSHYAALPQPGVAIDKFISALDGLQLGSARSQASLVLILSAFREQLATQFDSPPGASPASYSGINFNEPMAFASWYADSTPREIQNAERNAIVLRVTDRARFERALTLYQRSMGDFKELTSRASGGLRLLTVLPAFLPLVAKAMLERPLTTPKEGPLLSLSFIGGTEWNGYSIKVITTRKVDKSGHMTTDAACLIYIGDTAVLAPDVDSLRDVILRASSSQVTLAANPNFQSAVKQSGEAVYLSNLTQLFDNSKSDEKSQSKGVVSESGALRISDKTWENFYEIRFDGGDWLKPFMLFQPEGLASPRELLPRSTLAYYFMNFESVAAWRDWSHRFLDTDGRKTVTSIWAKDFEKEVLPELGPECGIAVLGLPNLFDGNPGFPYVVFFKLKSDKLARALQAGTLFVGSSPGQEVVQIKRAAGDLFAVVKGDFLVFSETRSAIAALDNKENLNSSRDFSRAAKLAPADLVAFGGYNLEAAVAAIGDSGVDTFETQRSSLIASLSQAFHSPNFYATANSGAVQGRFSLSMDQEGRFSVSELSSLSKEYRLTYAQVEARGVPIQNQERLSSLKLRVRTKASGALDRIRDDVSSPHQIVEKTSDTELLLRVLPRHSEPKTRLTLPIQGAEFKPYLQPANEIRSDDKSVIEKGRSIAGEERDAWKVARQLADWTYKNIKWKRVDNASAPQTLATLEADCLEFSQLYVAMARSLGLPARIVSGLAFSGTAFGGHAWVEVYVGDWIELDPTWGTDFVDATHIRNTADGAMLTYAALNLVELEVLEAPRGIPEFQKDPRTLTLKLCEELPRGNTAALTSALDLSVLTSETASLGSWSLLSDPERGAISAAYQRIVLEITSGFTERVDEPANWRLLKLMESGDRAEAVVITSGIDESLEKLRFAKDNGAWFLIEMVQADTNLHVISETLQPAVRTILDRRINKSARSHTNTEFVRVLIVLQKDPAAAVAIADRALKDDPTNQNLRHAKALALVANEKLEDAIRLWKELAGEEKAFAPALHSLAAFLSAEDDTAKKRMAIEFYNRYSQLEPDDPRPHLALAGLYENSGDDVRAEAEYKAAIRSDPLNTTQYVEFAGFLALRKRFEETLSIMDEAFSKSRPNDDPFGDLMTNLYFAEDKTIAEGVARSQPLRMEKSAKANLYLGYLRLENGDNLKAMPLLRKAAALEKDWAEPHVAISRAYRALKNWTAALVAADTAITHDSENGDAYYQRACALTRLGRIADALLTIAKAVELDPDYAAIIEEEADLKALASKPAFKKLLVVEEPKK